MSKEAPTWQKRGLVFVPQTNSDWLSSHAAIPVVDRMADGYRIYFSSRDIFGRAQIGYFVTDESCQVIHRVSKVPVFKVGCLGAFDDSGVTTSWIVNHDKQKYLYYSGWSLGVTVPFYFFIGLAISEDGGETYERISAAPILERNHIDPYLTASPCVLIEDGTWRMWYVSGTGWDMDTGRARHRYHIKYAESSDGISWKRDGVVCIDYSSRDEYAIARPCVIEDKGIYKMWYCYRGAAYRIGYAESRNGIEWKRKDLDAGLNVSESGWDSEMVAYPYVFQSDSTEYLLYNGNGYGRTGIGLAARDYEPAPRP